MKDNQQMSIDRILALPPSFVESFLESTGVSPVPHIIWNYDTTSQGEPFPITEIGEVALQIYYHRKGETS